MDLRSIGERIQFVMQILAFRLLESLLKSLGCGRTEPRGWRHVIIVLRKRKDFDGSGLKFPDRRIRRIDSVAAPELVLRRSPVNTVGILGIL